MINLAIHLYSFRWKYLLIKKELMDEILHDVSGFNYFSRKPFQYIGGLWKSRNICDEVEGVDAETATFFPSCNAEPVLVRSHIA